MSYGHKTTVRFSIESDDGNIAEENGFGDWSFIAGDPDAPPFDKEAS